MLPTPIAASAIFGTASSAVHCRQSVHTSFLKCTEKSIRVRKSVEIFKSHQKVEKFKKVRKVLKKKRERKKNKVWVVTNI